MQYLKLLNSTRIKKYENYCVIQDQITGVSSVVSYSESIILLTLQGVLMNMPLTGVIEKELLLNKDLYNKVQQITLEKREKFKGKMDINILRKISRWKNAESIVPCGAFVGSLTINYQL